MQDEKQGPDRVRTGKRNTGGLPVARDATQLHDARRTPESPVDRDKALGASDRDQESGTPPAER